MKVWAFGLILGLGFLGPAASLGDEPVAKTTQAEIQTSFGNIVIELDEVSSPRTCGAFLSYIQQHVYDESGFFGEGMNVDEISGGRPGPHSVGFSASGNFFTNEPPGEFKLKHVRGAVGMARTVGDCNPHKTSNSTQFYIMTRAAPQDDGQYSIFGHIVQGMDVVDKIAAALQQDQKTKIKFDVVLLSWAGRSG